GFYDGSFLGGLISNLKLFFKLKILKLEKCVYNFRTLYKMYPSLVIVSDSNNFYLTIKEANLLGIPSVAFIDSDLDFYYSFFSLFGNNESRITHFFLIFLLLFNFFYLF